MKKRSILIFLLGISISSFSQYDFKRGFIVKGKDTIQGFIDYTVPNTNSYYCFFKKDSNDNVIKYTPYEIEAYGINDAKLFVKKTITIENSNQPVFLEYLMNGIVDLYYYRRLNTNFYFIEKDGILYPLTNEMVKVNINNHELIKESQKYIGILTWLMGDAKELRSEIYSTELNHNSLIKLSRDYHNMVCDEECIVYYKKQKRANDAKWHVDVGILADYVMAGMSLNVSMNSISNLWSYEFYNPNTGHYELKEKWIKQSIITNTNAQFKSFIGGYSPGLFLNLNQNNRFSFQVQLKYQYMKNSRVEVDKIQFPFLMTYDFMRYTKAIPYLIAGIGNDFYTRFKAVTPLYANYDYLTKVELDYENMQIVPVYSQRVIEYEEKIVLRKSYYPVLMTGMGLSYELKNHKKVKLEIIGSYNYIENEINSEIHYNINSELKFTNFAFSFKYEF